MSLDLDRSQWKRVRFGDVARSIIESVKDPSAEGIDRVIAMEHLDPNQLQITRWGDVADGTTFTRRVRPGQTLFGKRRAYQRKAALAEFDAICSADILVFEAVESTLLPELLPFLVQSQGFYAHAVGTSAGSLSPRTNWKDLSAYSFDLPPLDEQRRIANLLWKIEEARRSQQTLAERMLQLRESWLHEQFIKGAATASLVELNQLVDPERPVCYGVLMPGPEVEDGRRIVDVKDYPAGQIDVASVRRCDPAIEAQFTRSRIKAGDVLLSIRGTIGRVALVPPDLEGENISRDSARIAGAAELVTPSFLRMVLESPDVQAEIRRTTTGLAVKGINVARIRALRVPYWPKARQEVLTNELDLIEETHSQVSSTVSALHQMRGALSGQVFGQ